MLITAEEALRSVIPEIKAAEVTALDHETIGLDPRRYRIRLLSPTTGQGAWLVGNFSVDVRDLLEVLGYKNLVVH